MPEKPDDWRNWLIAVLAMLLLAESSLLAWYLLKYNSTIGETIMEEPRATRASQSPKQKTPVPIKQPIKRRYR